MTVTIELQFLGQEIDTIPDIPYESNMTVRQAMEAGLDQTGDHRYRFTLRWYGHAYGYFLDALGSSTDKAEVAGQTGFQGRACTFWALYVNGELSPSGIDQTILKDADIVSWRYQQYTPEQHSGSVYESAATRTRLVRPRSG